MRKDQCVAVVIPALNEAQSIGNVLDAIPDWVDDIVVADNGSTDATADIARDHGARVVAAPRRGYGSACLAGIAALDSPDIVVFLDADFSDHPDQMPRLVDPIVAGDAEMVIGSRVLGNADRGALTPQAYFGNKLACALIRLIWGVRYTDLGPFRAIRFPALQRLGVADPDYGWTVEMQIKAAVAGIVAQEAPVDYRKRIGRSKVSGTLRGVVGASYKILGHIAVGALAKFRGSKLRGAHGAARSAVILFTRYPEAGKTKTRMIPALGPEGAADLQRSMTEYAATQVAKLGDNVQPVVRYTGGSDDEIAAWLGDNWVAASQGEGDLGDRMGRAFRASFQTNNIDRAVILGSDCPDLNAGILRAALSALDDHDVVIGPATDGGYYLIGMRKRALDRAVPALFEGVEWGTSSVLTTTLERIAATELSSHRLAPLDDIDRPEDLAVWERSRDDAQSPYLSVVIPVLNESDHIAAVVDSAQQDDTEVIVVDGGSTDATSSIATENGAQVLHASGGRAAQMNAGSAKARGKIILFLHGDTRLPEGYLTQVRRAMDGGAAAGAFRLQTDDTSRTLRWMSWVANLRSKWLRSPYGDQALFLRRQTFRELGGYRDLPIMEDFDLVRRLAKRGPIKLVDAEVVTSARRWRRLGAWRTMFRNQAAILAWYAGMSPEKIAAYYHRGRNARKDGE